MNNVERPMSRISSCALLLSIAACESGSANQAGPSHDAGATMTGARHPSAQLTLLPPSHGIQLTTVGREIGAGADEEWCEVVELSGDSSDELLVGRTELAMTPFSHHLIVSMPQGSAPVLEAAELHAPARCSGAHEYGDGLVTLAAAAEPYVAQDLPAGIGFRLHGGQRLLFDYHVFNSSQEPIHAHQLLNLHLVDHIDKPARTFGFYLQYLEVPPHAERVFADECQVKNDLLVWALGRHTHRQGTEYRVWWAGGEHDGELIWSSSDWEREIGYRFDQPQVVPAGTGFRWECTFDNTSDGTLVFGNRATDEMCILFGAFAAVGDDAAVGPQSCYLFAPSQ